MSKKKKFVSLICKILSPIISLYLMLGTTSFALAAEPSQLQVVMGNVIGHPGQEVTMPISFKNVPVSGISACNFIIKYDPTKMVAESATAGDIISNSAADFQEPTIDAVNGQIIFMFSDASCGDRIINKDGVFANIKFKINQGVASGSYTVSRLQNVHEDFADGQTVTKLNPYPQFVDGTVNVQEVVNSMEVVMGNVSGHPGDEVTMPINFKNVPISGISACNFILKYDPTKMVAESATAGEIIVNSAADFQEPTIDAANGQIIFMFSDTSGGSRIISQDGTFANIKFKIDQGVASGDYVVSRLQNIHEDFADGVTVTKLNPYPQFVDGNVSVDATVVTNSDEQDVVADTKALDLGDTSSVISSLTLPTTGTNGSTISWLSSNPLVVGNDGTVVIPIIGAQDAVVTLTATIIKGSASATKQFSVTVKAMTDTDLADVNAASSAFTLGNTTAVTNNLTLPISGLSGTTISWISSNPSVVGNDGTVVRPAVGQQNVTVTLTATITKGNASVIKDFTVTVKAQENAVQVVIGSATGAKGSEVTLPIKVNNVAATVSGISSLTFIVKYDPSKVEATSATAGTIIPNPDINFQEPTIDNINGYAVLSFIDISGGENLITTDGTFANLKFKIKADTANGDYNIEHLTDESEVTADVDGKQIETQFTKGTIKVTDIKYGDVNGDGKVNTTDAYIIIRYATKKIADFPTVNGKAAADVNGDGKANTTDAYIIIRYATKKIPSLPR